MYMKDALQNSLTRLIDALERNLNADKPEGKDIWEKGKIISGWIATIFIPLAIGIAGHWVSLSLKRQEADAKVMELSVQILTSKATGETNNKRIRRWAMSMLEEKSGLLIPEETKAVIEGSTVPSTSFAPPWAMVLDSTATQAEIDSHNQSVERLMKEGIH